MTGVQLNLPDNPSPFIITVDGHLIARVCQDQWGQWLLRDYEGYPIAQSRRYDGIIKEARKLIGEM
jgi:hypothetical protein